MKQNEFEILRAVSAYLDEDTVFVMSYQYHTEKDPDDPEGRRNDRSKSRYRMIGFVDKVANVKAKIEELKKDANRLEDWKWTDDPSWDGNILYMYGANNASKANWLRLKLKKAISWENALRVFQGYKKDIRKTDPETGRRNKTFGQYIVMCPNAIYPTDGYSCTDGSTVDITDVETLKTKIGQTICREIKMKLVGPKEN